MASVATAAPPDRAARYSPSDRMSGSAVAVVGSPLGRGVPRPTRPRAEAFVPGQLPADRPPAARVRPPFHADKAAAFPGRVDVVFYARSRPIHVRVTVRTNGKPLADRWQDHVKKLFAAFDRDGNGSLNRYEAEYIFPAAGMQNMFQGEQYYRSGAALPGLNDLDQDGDGGVSLPELAHYYRGVVDDLIRARPVPFLAGGNDQATRELFARLDRDGDGKLSEPELRSAEKILLALDGDEDECVSSQEVLANPTDRTPVRVAAAPIGMARMPGGVAPRPASREMEVFHNGVPAEVVKQVVKRYDEDDDSHLTRGELDFPPAVFDRLDNDDDGKLSASELDRWRTGPPDAIVALELGDTPEACKATASPPVGAAWPKGMTVRQIVPNRLVLRVGPQTVEFTATAAPPGLRRRGRQEGAAAVFPQGQTAVTDESLVGPQFQFLRVIFFDADFNGDGTLTREEFNRYFSLQQDTTEIALSLSHAVRTPNLFQTLDDNLDGKLGVRELRTAWDRLIVLEPRGSTAVTEAILQPNGSLRLASAAYAFYDPAANSRPGMVRSDRPRPTGPLWFRKMDRNTDGDVSRGEFLGDEADFAMLDADGDDLIALKEAAAYEKKVRPGKPDAKKSKKK